jgi:fibro-slime domain-containing protein
MAINFNAPGSTVIKELRHRRLVYSFALAATLLVGCAPGEDGPDRDLTDLSDGGMDAAADGDTPHSACSGPGCACEPGTEPKTCHPAPIYAANGSKLCAQGTMYCRGGSWSSCESLVGFDLTSSSGSSRSSVRGIASALISDASICQECNPDCFKAVDKPNAGDLTAANSSNVDYDPLNGGIHTHVLVNGTQRGAINATAICGNGLLENGINGGVEECDDGNAAALDGCDAFCRLEKNVNWFCPTPGMPCKQGTCGNGMREGSEPCDDGNNIIGDGCGLNCVVEPTCAVGSPCESSCGDGIRLPGDLDEQCDDGNPRNNDGCSSTCKIESGFTCTDVAGTLPATFPLTVTYRDFIAFPINTGYTHVNGENRHLDFETFSGSGTQGMVQSTLVGGKPKYTGVKECNNQGAPFPTKCQSGAQSTSEANFNQWYSNASPSPTPAAPFFRFVDTINMAKQADSSYRNPTFGSQLYPLDSRGWVVSQVIAPALVASSARENKNSNHNFGFTSEIHHWFQFKGGEVLTFAGDDDVWVFIGGKLAMDLGGLHGKLERTIRLNALGTVDCYKGNAVKVVADCETPTRNLGLLVGSVYEMTLFHAERHTSQSNFDLTLNGFVATRTSCVSKCGDGVVTTTEFCDDGLNNGKAGYCFTDCSGRASKYAPTASYWRDYTAVGTCKIPPERPLWGKLNWKGDSSAGGSIAFKLQGAETPAALAAAPGVTVSISSNLVKTGSFDVRAALSGANLQPDSPYLRVTAVLTSSADQKITPILNEFDVSHTCVNAQ